MSRTFIQSQSKMIEYKDIATIH